VSFLDEKAVGPAAGSSRTVFSLNPVCATASDCLPARETRWAVRMETTACWQSFMCLTTLQAQLPSSAPPLAPASAPSPPPHAVSPVPPHTCSREVWSIGSRWFRNWGGRHWMGRPAAGRRPRWPRKPGTVWELAVERERADSFADTAWERVRFFSKIVRMPRTPGPTVLRSFVVDSDGFVRDRNGAQCYLLRVWPRGEDRRARSLALPLLREGGVAVDPLHLRPAILMPAAGTVFTFIEPDSED
jgi:hypothetical protein